MNTTKCRVCKEEKPIKEIKKIWSSTIIRGTKKWKVNFAHCFDCSAKPRKEYRHQYYLKNKDKSSEQAKKWVKENRDKYLVWLKGWNKRNRIKTKLKILKHYGEKCACCEENAHEFLSIDHINGDGNKHRKEIRKDLYAWLIRNNYPKEFQTLCFNCNFSKGHYGYCPHKK